MEIQTFPRAVYKLGEYAEAANEGELKALESDGYADWSIDFSRQMGETVEAPKRRGRPPKAEASNDDAE